MRMQHLLTLVVVGCLALTQTVNAQAPLESAFTYQGELTAAGTPLHGLAQADIRATLWDAPSGGAQIGSASTAYNVDFDLGRFTVDFDFGTSPFAGDARFIELAVREPAGSGSFVTLSPRQPITAVPYALFALDGAGGESSLWTEDGGDIYYTDGNVGIGYATPNRKLYILDNQPGVAYPLKLSNPGIDWNESSVGVLFSVGGTGGGPEGQNRGKGALVYTYTNTWNRGAFHFLQNTEAKDTNPDLTDSVLTIKNNGRVGIGTTSPASRLHVNGTTTTDVLTITGADLAEKFPVTDSVQPGTVVEIDPVHPGQLRRASGAYNRRVAGVVSGANDLPAGAILGNLKGSENAPPIALSGRVWTRCNTSNGSIRPGDLLTTSDVSGEAMKVGDHGRAQGAIIGKAMTSLEDGSGFVLVLVSLQ